MPELPEVHTITSDLKKHIIGHEVVGVKIEEGYRALPDNKTFVSNVKGKIITDVRRLAKNILIKLEDDSILHFHLAMTGRILLRDNIFSDKWTRVSLCLKRDKLRQFLNFTDTRKFGKISYFKDFSLSGLESKYGPDLISTDLDGLSFATTIRKRNTSIKNALLDQHVVAGLGNIYATEALFLAGINPHRAARSLTQEELSGLLKGCVTVLNEGITHRGSTLPDKMYVDIFGNSGNYQNHFKIYLKSKCPKCETAVKIDKISGRGTYFCPKCQK